MGMKTEVSSLSQDNDWRAENDLRTLIFAEEIKMDKYRFRAALKKRDDMKKALGGIRNGKEI